MPVALIDDRLRIRLGRQGAGLELAGIETEPHRAPLVGDVALLRQQVDHGVAGEGVELGAVGIGLAQQVAAELDDGTLHPEAKPKVGRERGPGEACRGDLALDAAMTEPSRDHHAVHLIESAQVSGLQGFGGDPFDVDPEIVVYARMTERFRHADVGVRRW